MVGERQHSHFEVKQATTSAPLRLLTNHPVTTCPGTLQHTTATQYSRGIIVAVISASVPLFPPFRFLQVCAITACSSAFDTGTVIRRRCRQPVPYILLPSANEMQRTKQYPFPTARNPFLALGFRRYSSLEIYAYICVRVCVRSSTEVTKRQN